MGSDPRDRVNATALPGSKDAAVHPTRPAAPPPPREPTRIGGHAGPAIPNTPDHAAPAVPTRLPTSLPATARPSSTAAPSVPRPTPAEASFPPATTASAPPRAPSIPSTVQGAVRRPVQLDEHELARRLPGIPAADRAALPPLLAGVILETLTPVRASAWGEAVQREYAGHTDAALAIARTPALEEASRHVRRLHELLGEIGHALDADTTRGWSMFKRASPRDAYKRREPEIDQLRRQLNALQPAIDRVHAEFATLGTRAGEIRERLTHHALAADVLASLMESRDAPTATTLAERARSLLRAAAQLHESDLLRAAHAEQVTQLALTLRDVILGTLPAWIEQITYAVAPNATEAYQLHRRVEEIRAHLRP